MSDTPEKIGGMKLLTVDEMRERFPLPSTPETDAFYGELHPEQGLLEHARSLERRLHEAHDMCDRYAEQLQAARREVEELREVVKLAVKWHGLVGAARASASGKLFGPNGLAHAALAEKGKS